MGSLTNSSRDRCTLRRDVSESALRGARGGLRPHPGVYPEPRRVHPSVSRRCRRLTPICDHGSGSPSPLVSIETRARARRSPRRGTRRARKPRSIDFIGAGGGDLGSQPASAHTLYLWKWIGVLEIGSMREPRGARFSRERRALRAHTRRRPPRPRRSPRRS